MESYDAEFSGRVIMDFYKSTVAPSTRQKARIVPAGQFSPFPVRDGVRLVAMIQSSPLDEETFALRDRLAKSCLLRVPVEYQIEGQTVARLITLTDVNQNLETDPAIIENPMFYSFLLDITTAHVLSSFTLPPKEVPVPGAAEPVNR